MENKECGEKLYIYNSRPQLISGGLRRGMAIGSYQRGYIALHVGNLAVPYGSETVLTAQDVITV